ncbi:hypothetical protein PMAYCL1PPCAC_17356, partial [Pristionchus mayeri]
KAEIESTSFLSDHRLYFSHFWFLLVLIVSTSSESRRSHSLMNVSIDSTVSQSSFVTLPVAIPTRVLNAASTFLFSSSTLNVLIMLIALCTNE